MEKRYECHIDDNYVAQLFQMWTWVPSRRRPPLWVRWFQLLPLLFKVKTFPLFYFPPQVLYSVWGCLSFFLFTGGVIVVLELSTALATLVWITGGTILVTRVSMKQPQWVGQDKTPTYSWPCNIFVHKTRQDITGGTGHNKKLTFTRQYKSGHVTFYKD